MSGRSWGLFIFRRLLALIALLVVISFAVFSLQYLAPGSVIDALLGNQARSPENVAYLTREFNLDEPFLTQYWLWAKDALHFDFGNSIQSSLPVTDEIEARLPVSLFLGIYAYLLTIVFGIALGAWAALRKQRGIDRGIVAGTTVAQSTPAFVSGVILIYLFAILLPWFPSSGKGEGFLDQLWHLTLPAVALALLGAAYVLKHTRAAMITVLEQDYVTFARARGLSSRRIMFVYVLRNALIPVVTISGVLLAFTITGAVLVEETFSVPGIGHLMVQSATAKDLPMLQGVAIVVAVVIMVANLLADIAYIIVDPRIRLGRGRA